MVANATGWIIMHQKIWYGSRPTVHRLCWNGYVRMALFLRWRRSERKRKIASNCRRYVLKWPLATKLPLGIIRLKGPVLLQNHAGEVENPYQNTTSGLVPPSWKLTASIFFNVCGPPGAPINWTFTLAMFTTQTENYFLFAVGRPSPYMFKNGLWPLRPLLVRPRGRVLMKKSRSRR